MNNEFKNKVISAICDLMTVNNEFCYIIEEYKHLVDTDDRKIYDWMFKLANEIAAEVTKAEQIVGKIHDETYVKNLIEYADNDAKIQKKLYEITKDLPDDTEIDLSPVNFHKLVLSRRSTISNLASDAIIRASQHIAESENK